MQLILEAKIILMVMIFPIYKYFKIADNKISSWESKGLSNEKINLFPRLINNQSPSLAYDNARMKLTFNGDFFKTR